MGVVIFTPPSVLMLSAIVCRGIDLAPAAGMGE
jgi:hypothetical protein